MRPRLSVSERALERVGTIVQGKYRIDWLVGIGGMAAVYAATDDQGRRIAIKFLLERFSDDADVLQLFDREAHAANQVEHPRAVPVLDHDVDDNGNAFLVMPLLHGETLRRRWERASDKRLPVIEVAVFMCDVLEVLSSAHEKGIVHRDIKPENLFVTASADVHVLDFGIARRIDGAGTATVTGRMVGTPAFMPPEQASGARDAIGPFSDCWAVGATMFTLLSGEFVHAADGASAQLAAAISRTARSLGDVMPTLPPAVVQFVDKALAFDPKDRWASAREMRVALLEALESALGAPVEALAPQVRAKVEAELAAHGSEAAETQAPARLPDGRAVSMERSNRKRSRSFTKALLAGAAALGIAVAAFGLRRATNQGGAVGAPVTVTASEREAGEPVNNPALAHVRAGVQNWRDGSIFAAEQDFDRALELDPSLAEAHFYAMLLLNDEEVVREHYQNAVAHRNELKARDRAILDAFGVAMTVPWNLNAAAERLLTIRDEYAKDWVVITAITGLKVQSGKGSEALPLLDELLGEDPSVGLAWSDKAEAHSFLGDAVQTRSSVEECVRRAAHADACLDKLMWLDMDEGRCAEAEQSARLLMATPLAPKWWGIRLADAIYGRGGTLESVRNVLDQQWRSAAPAEREATRLRGEARFDVLTGNFAELERVLDAWNKLLAGKKYEIDHVPVESLRFNLAMELGDRRRAAQLAAQYLSQRDSLLASMYDWEIVPLRTQYLAGGLSRQAFETRRQAWLDRVSNGPPRIEELNSRWTEAYAHAAVTQADALAALRALPQNPPVWDVIRQEPEDELAAGKVYFLAGDTDTAVRYFRHGARRCQALRRPFEHTWLHLHLGMALERTGDTAGACAAYDVVLKRWGKEPRSVSAKTARARRASLHCPNEP
ncbi:protein kinase [Pendulispora brunnea]|uniref:Protein kinase n=1 Tax=Pendulispora brunnea TaxID=2905690 RepID=A0ABZ2KMP7_9BACT